MTKLTLSQVLSHIDSLGGELAKDKPLVDLNGIIPQSQSHQTVLFIRSPYEGALEDPKVKDRIIKLLTSLNRPDTMKVDVFTVQGANVIPGYQPHAENLNVDGEKVGGPLFNQDWLVGAMHTPYVLQITVDVVWPPVMAQALGVPVDEIPAVKKKAGKKYLSFDEVVGKAKGIKPPNVLSKDADFILDDPDPFDDGDEDF